MEMVHKQDPSKFPTACRDAECLERFLSEQTMEAYAIFCHTNADINRKCPQCQKDLLGATAARLHMCGNITKKPRVRSDICETSGKAFIDKHVPQKHQLTHTGPESWAFSCETCKKKCMTKQKLEEHMRIHTQDKPFQCSYCGHKHAHRHNLRIHVHIKHGDIAQDIPHRFDKTYLTSRKGIPLGKRKITSSGIRKRKISKPGCHTNRKRRTAGTPSSE